MASHKRTALQKQRVAFEAQLGDMSDAFARERIHQNQLYERRDTALRIKACESKNRYACRADAEEAIAQCAYHGTTGLHCYRCSYCKGWHLTSKPTKASTT